jgi:hypothetical protein
MEGMAGAGAMAQALLSDICIVLALDAFTVSGSLELLNVWRGEDPAECTMQLIIALAVGGACLSRFRLERSEELLEEMLEADEKVRGQGFKQRALSVLNVLYEGSWTALHLMTFGIVSIAIVYSSCFATIVG